MATLKLTIFKSKILKDGRHKIRIAVCHKTETCYIVTRFVIDNESQFKNGRVVKRPDASLMNTKLRSLLNVYQERLDLIPNIDLYDCRQLKRFIEKDESSEGNATFQDVSKRYIQRLNEVGRKTYATLLDRNGRYFTEFTKGDIHLQNINPFLIDNYADFLVKRGISNTTVNIMLAQTKVIINQGIKEQLVRYDVHPFLGRKIPAAPVREVDLSLEAFNRIRMANPDLRKHVMAHDLFCLSFYLGGINLIDLMNLDFRGKKSIEYVRAKSRGRTQGVKTVVLTVPEQAMRIISKWMNKNTGKLDFGYKLAYRPFAQYVTNSLASLARELGITEKVVFYSARKTFAQFASEIGIPDGIIDYCLGHSDGNKGVIRYYRKIRQQQADVAIEKVIDYVNNPNKYKEYIELRRDIMMMRL